jgi:hypothetical protein
MPMCIAAVKKTPRAILHIKNKTKKICLEAVKGDGSMLQYIDWQLQTRAMCLEVIKQNANNFKYIKNKTKRYYIELYKKMGDQFQYIQ